MRKPIELHKSRDFVNTTIISKLNLLRGFFLAPDPDNFRCGQKQIRTVTVPTDCECSWFTSQSKVVLWTSRIKSDRRVITMTYAATPNYHLGVGSLDHQKIVPLTFFWPISLSRLFLSTMLDLQLGERENYTLCQRSHFLSGGGRIRTMCDWEKESRLARVVWIVFKT